MGCLIKHANEEGCEADAFRDWVTSGVSRGQARSYRQAGVEVQALQK